MQLPIIAYFVFPPKLRYDTNYRYDFNYYLLIYFIETQTRDLRVEKLKSIISFLRNLKLEFR